MSHPMLRKNHLNLGNMSQHGHGVSAPDPPMTGTWTSPVRVFKAELPRSQPPVSAGQPASWEDLGCKAVGGLMRIKMKMMKKHVKTHEIMRHPCLDIILKFALRKSGIN